MGDQRIDSPSEIHDDISKTPPHGHARLVWLREKKWSNPKKSVQIFFWRPPLRDTSVMTNFIPRSLLDDHNLDPCGSSRWSRSQNHTAVIILNAAARVASLRFPSPAPPEKKIVTKYPHFFLKPKVFRLILLWIRDFYFFRPLLPPPFVDTIVGGHGFSDSPSSLPWRCVLFSCWIECFCYGDIFPFFFTCPPSLLWFHHRPPEVCHRPPEVFFIGLLLLIFWLRRAAPIDFPSLLFHWKWKKLFANRFW